MNAARDWREIVTERDMLVRNILPLLMLAPLATAATAQTAASRPAAPPRPAAATQARPQAASTLAISRQRERRTSAAPAANFTGGVRVEALFGPAGGSRMSGASVSFAPRARTAWHSHPLGQTLIVTAGQGRVQVQGQRVQEMAIGDVVRIAPGAKHWHGAGPSAGMTHLALQEATSQGAVTWMEKVTDAQYDAR